MAGNIVGSAYVHIHAITKGIGREIEEGLNKTKVNTTGAGNIGKKIGDTVSKSISDGMTGGLNRGSGQALAALRKTQNEAARMQQKFISNAKKGPKFLDALIEPGSAVFQEVKQARESFNQLTKSGMKMTAIIGTVITSVSDLVIGLGALIFGAAAAAPAFVALAGVFIQFKLGMLATKLAMQGVMEATGALWKSQTALNDSFRAARLEFRNLKFEAEGAAYAEEGAALALQQAKIALQRVQDLPPNTQARRQAELAYKQADLSYRQAIDKTKEATRAVDKGITATQAYQPFASLTKTQLAFTKFLVTLRPKMQELRGIAADSFIPALRDGISTLVNRDFGMFKTGIGNLSKGMSGLVKGLFGAFDDPKFKKSLSQVFAGAGDTLPKLGKTFGNVFKLIMTWVSAAQPLIKTFSTWLEKTTGNASKLFQSKKDSGELTKFFENAGVVAAKLGAIIKNVFTMLNSFTKANAGPGSGGQMLLDWIKDVSGKFAEWTKSAPGQKSLFSYFKDGAANFKQMSQTIGKFIKPLFTMAGDPDIKQMWATIGEAAPNFESILKKTREAAPAMGRLVKQIIRVIDTFTDPGQIKAFFDTFTKALKMVGDFFNQPWVKSIMTWLGPITGVLLALGTIGSVGQKVFMALAGHIQVFASPMKKAIGYFTELDTGIMKVGRHSKALDTLAAPSDARFSKIARAGRRTEYMAPTSRRAIKEITGQGLAIGKADAMAGMPMTSVRAGSRKELKAFSQGQSLAAGSGPLTYAKGIPATDAATTGFQRMGIAAKTALRDIGKGFGALGGMLKRNWVILAIAALVVALVALYNKSKDFRDLMNTYMNSVGKVLMKTFKSIMIALQPLIDAFMELFDALFGGEGGGGGLVGMLLTALKPVLGIIIGVIATVLQAVAPLIVLLVKVLVPVLTFIVDIITALVNGINLVVGGILSIFGVKNDMGSVDSTSSPDLTDVTEKNKVDWAQINKDQKEAATRQMEAANQQLEAAKGTKDKGDDKLAAAYANAVEMQNVQKSSAFEQLIYYFEKSKSETDPTKVRAQQANMIAIAKKIPFATADIKRLSGAKNTEEAAFAAYKAALANFKKNSTDENAKVVAQKRLVTQNARSTYQGLRSQLTTKYARYSIDPATGNIIDRDAGGAPVDTASTPTTSSSSPTGTKTSTAKTTTTTTAVPTAGSVDWTAINAQLTTQNGTLVSIKENIEGGNRLLKTLVTLGKEDAIKQTTLTTLYAAGFGLTQSAYPVITIGGKRMGISETNALSQNVLGLSYQAVLDRTDEYGR